MTKRDDERTLAAQMLAELRTLAQTTTELAARFQGQVINNVLEVGTQIIPAGGTYVPFEWQAACGSFEIDNQGTHPMQVTSAGPTASGAAPTSGTGVTNIPAGAVRKVNVASHQVTVYGTAADVFCYQAFTAGARPVV